MLHVWYIFQYIFLQNWVIFRARANVGVLKLLGNLLGISVSPLVKIPKSFHSKEMTKAQDSPFEPRSWRSRALTKGAAAKKVVARVRICWNPALMTLSKKSEYGSWSIWTSSGLFPLVFCFSIPRNAWDDDTKEKQIWQEVSIRILRRCANIPICPMYGIFTNICPKNPKCR